MTAGPGREAPRYRVWLRPTAVLAASVLALFSAWHSIGHMRGLLEVEGQSFAQYTPTQRRQAPVSQLGINGGIFDFFASHVAPGDRIYFQVMPSGLTTYLDLPSAVAALGRFYLLPGVETTDLAHATVVVSYFADPSLLHVKFVTQVRAGLQPLWLSRIRSP